MHERRGDDARCTDNVAEPHLGSYANFNPQNDTMHFHTSGPPSSRLFSSIPGRLSSCSTTTTTTSCSYACSKRISKCVDHDCDLLLISCMVLFAASEPRVSVGPPKNHRCCVDRLPAPTFPTSPTLKVVKKNSPGESCRNRTPASATGASKNSTSSLLKQKQPPMATPAASRPTSTRSRSSSRWSQMGICTTE